MSELDSQGLDNQAEAEAPGPGAIISYAREQLGISSEDLAAELKITKHKLGLLECNAFSQVGTNTFVRGYLRNAARVLQIDAQLLLDEFNAFVGEQQEPQTESLAPSAGASTARKPLVVVLLLALFCAGAWSLYQYMADSNKQGTAEHRPNPQAISSPAAALSSEETKPETELAAGLNTENLGSEALNSEVANASGATPAETLIAAPKAGEASPQATELNINADSGSSASAAPAASDVLLAVDELAAGPDGSLNSLPEADAFEAVNALRSRDTQNPLSRLQFSFTERCWLQVKDATGKRLYSNTKQAGQTLNLQGKAPFRLNIGNVRAVTLRVDGEIFTLEPQAGRKTLAVTIP